MQSTMQVWDQQFSLPKLGLLASLRNLLKYSLWGHVAFNDNLLLGKVHVERLHPCTRR